jgi:hypothetical protein
MDLKFEGCGPNYMVFFVFGSLEIVFVVYLLSEVCYKMLLVCCHFFLLNTCMLSFFFAQHLYVVIISHRWCPSTSDNYGHADFLLKQYTITMKWRNWLV